MSAALAAILDEDPFPVPPPRGRPARRIRDDAEAIAVAREVARTIAAGAVERDQERRLPYEEMDLISDAGLLAITVPKAFGGAGVASGTVAEVIAILSAADGSIGQIPQNHFFILEALRLEGSEAQQRFFYARILDGERIGNALSELGTRTAQDHATRLGRTAEGLRLNGRKFYSTGALFAHWIAVVANDDENRSTIALVPRDSAGLTVVDDWSGFGQRVTGSGTTILDNVAVHPFAVISLRAVFERPTSMGPFAQIMHAAVEQGIARAALDETIRFVTTRSRPWKDAGVDRASDDPYTVAEVGELKIRLDGSQALLTRSGRFVDAAQHAPSTEAVAAASVAVAEAKVASTEAALQIASKLIELAGSQATLTRHGLDRFWRNARTHTVHDPIRWKYRAIGDYWLNGINPPRHGAI
ncbi:SfnB family sulfur acquisition oxidoreductase [Labrys wisconsinensis]|uniref:Dibenzothiophene monooxygenase n=1 Tax=Labrys wisconsinensis TaxID=425677 RepID=A0ABU0JBT7_9HYPH|nr:SfnB family sulfur acquisition oxidoreductase [Labrys wisconsinensis]MDQ0470744.1 SfnB family sulfur acquisition oxidoreductase [Labrys wisconsinensis]